MLRRGVTRAFGTKLRSVIFLGTRNRVYSFLSGVFVTLLLQSSTATTLIVSSFASKNLITASSALAVILGADVGTSVACLILSYDLSWLYSVLMITGFFLFTFKKSPGLWKNSGRALIGLSLMLLSLRLIKEYVAPLEHSEILPFLLDALESDLLFTLFVSAIVTWLFHSSLAFVLLTASFAHAGLLLPDLGAIMVIGANMGGCFAPIIATIKEPAALRITTGNLIARFLGAIVFLQVTDIYGDFISLFSVSDSEYVVLNHVGLNLFIAILFLPAAGVISEFCSKIVKEKSSDDDLSNPKHLDINVLEIPPLALACATRETIRIADIVERMLSDTMLALKHNDKSFVDSVREKDDVVDNLYMSVKSYMAKISHESMDSDEAYRYVQVLSFATIIEHTGDIIDKSLMPIAAKKIRNQYNFSDEGFKEIEEIHKMTLESLVLAQSLFVYGDIDTAGRILEKRTIMKQAEADASIAHIHRIRRKVPESISTSSIHMDIIRDLVRINSYMCDLAYPFIEKEEKLQRWLKV